MYSGPISLGFACTAGAVLAVLITLMASASEAPPAGDCPAPSPPWKQEPGEPHCRFWSHVLENGDIVCSTRPPLAEETATLIREWSSTDPDPCPVYE